MTDRQRTPQDLQQFLTQQGINAQLLHELGETPTVPAAAAALGVEPDQIIKTLLFVVEQLAAVDKGPMAVVVISRGERRVDRKRVAAHLGVSHNRIRFAPAQSVAKLLGYPAGGVPPFGHTNTLPTILDASVLAAAERTGGVVFGGGGDDRTMLRLTIDELVRVVQPAIVAVS